MQRSTHAVPEKLEDSPDLELFVSMVGILQGLKVRVARTGEELGAHMLLHRIACAGSVRVSDLAGIVGLDTSTVSRHVKALEDAGHVERHPDPHDGRASQLTLSDSGREALHEGLRLRAALVAEALDDWSAEDRAVLTQLARRLADTLAPATPSPRTESE